MGDRDTGRGKTLTSREHLLALLEGVDLVSPQQREAVQADGNFFLMARPGSGKTRTVGIRLAWWAVNGAGRRIAATSYTNVAIEQIRSTVQEVGVVLDASHFTGTIHQFLLRYVLYPFARPVLGWLRPIRLVDDNWHGWDQVVFRNNHRLRLPVSKFHFQADGTLVARDAPKSMTRDEATAEGRRDATRFKQVAAQHGLISLSDAMYYAQAILERDSRVVKSVAERFDEVIVDEAQDTSDVQLGAIELLHGGGLRSLVLVGDLDQSIFGFQGAAPGLCRDLVARLRLRQVPLTDNYRSSQAICDVTCHFRGHRQPDRAIGRYRDFGLAPEVLLYPPRQPTIARERFLDRLAVHGIELTKAVVLTRTHGLEDKMNGVRRTDISRPVAALGALGAVWEGRSTLTRETLDRVEALLAELAWDSSTSSLSDGDRRALRKATMRLVSALPPLNGTLADWVLAARTVVASVLGDLTATPAHKPGDRIRSEMAYRSIDVAVCFGAVSIQPLAQTVHAVKGESYAAVLLVADAAQRREVNQTELWSRHLVGQEIAAAASEELRIAYVALTRAEQYCAVALPDDCTKELLQAFTAAGFALEKERRRS
jgi:DNA helicase-2/ATP-dependent DNA helicase PcrA